MARIAYTSKKFSAGSQEIIGQANQILREYAAQGFDLTLRQLYYQFVARDIIANKQTEYKRLGSIINDARMAGLIDWNSIVDRTRELRKPTTWRNPQHIIKAVGKSYMIDMWANQPAYVEVWIEKDALVGVIEGICNDLRVPHFSCRGYTSQSEMWAAAQRIGKRLQKGKQVRILHLGDHDPSGIDMTRDVFDRLWLFMASDLYNSSEAISSANATATTNDLFKIERMALNMDQIEMYDPPPNPAKLTDSRARDYIARHGYSSWELDALDPTTLSSLIEDTTSAYIDTDVWRKDMAREDRETEQLQLVSNRWDDVVEFIEED